MKRTHVTSCLVLIGLLILVGGSAILHSLLSEYQILNGPQGMKRMTINIKASNVQGAAGMTAEESEKLLQKWGAAGAYATSLNQTVSHDNTSISSKVIGTNAVYPQFHQMWIRQ